MYNFLHFLLLLIVINGSFALEVQECPGIPKPYNVDVVACEKTPCPLIRGGNAGANITFNVLRDVDTLDLQVKAKVGFFEVNFPVPDPNVCHFLLNGYCPVEEGERLLYNFELPVSRHYPKIALILTLTIEDKYGPVACFKLPSRVVDKP